MLRGETVNHHRRVNMTETDVPTISTADTAVTKRVTAVRRDEMRIF
jgi:hypothetical protein